MNEQSLSPGDLVRFTYDIDVPLTLYRQPISSSKRGLDSAGRASCKEVGIVIAVVDPDAAAIGFVNVLVLFSNSTFGWRATNNFVRVE